MAYDDALAHRFRAALQDFPDVDEKRMMGGVCFFSNGNMIGGADRTKEGLRRLMFRVGKDQMGEALARPGAEPVELGGRMMNGFVFVAAEACDDQELRAWIALAMRFVSTLPAK